MKVVFFCGGLGTRLREYTETIPKSMVPIGERPMMWHLMRYYAHFGYTEFILCLGYKGHLIKQYFFDQSSLASSKLAEQPMLAEQKIQSDNAVEVLQQDGSAWHIQFVDSGVDANIAQRLCAARPYLGDDNCFLANYSDGLSDLPLPEHIEQFRQQQAVASFVAVQPQSSFHTVSLSNNNFVDDIAPAKDSGFWINGGFFVLSKAIFDYIEEGDELVEAPFQRLIKEKKLLGYPYNGFWSCMDTLKDKLRFDQLVTEQEKHWRVWM